MGNNFLLILLVSTLGLGNIGLAQQPSENTIYFAVQYMKAHPINDNDYVKLETQIWKKLHQARKDAGVLDGWYFYRVLSPSGINAEYNFVTVNVYNSKEKLAGHFENYGVDYSKILNSDEIAIALKTTEIRDIVSEEVWQREDSESRISTKVHSYQVVNSMRLKPGVTGDTYANLERVFWKPIHKARIDDKKMHSWGMYSLVMPIGTDVSYNWSTVDSYDQFLDILEDINPYIEQNHIEHKVKSVMENTLSTRDLLKSEVRVLIDYVN